MKLFKGKSNSKKKESSLDEILGKVNIFSSFAILLLDENRNILDVNKTFLNSFKFDYEDLIGKTTEILFSGYYPKSYYEEIWSTLQDGKEFSGSLNSKRKDGVIINSWLKILPQKNSKEEKFFLALYDTKGEETSFNMDVSESYKILLELVDKIPDIVCIKDGKGRWLYANEADLKLFQLENVNYRGKTDKSLAEYTHSLYGDSFLLCEQTDELCWEKGIMSRSDEVIPIPDGGNVVLDILKIPVFNKDGSRKNLIVIGRDVTVDRVAKKELKAALIQAKESDRLKSTFLATMSHELRTPLNSILGFSALVFDEDDLSEIRDYSRIINNNGQMLLNLIEDLFDISLIESDQMQIQKEEVDIVRVVNEVYEIFPTEINSLNKLDIEFKMDIPFDKLLIYTDPFRVKQIITNLLRNALKFTHQGYILIQLELQKENLFISIEDTGIGIKNEKIESLFNVFNQGEEGKNRKFGGAGIGLAISKKLSILLGGNIKAVSELDKGSRFTLNLPLGEKA